MPRRRWNCDWLWVMLALICFGQLGCAGAPGNTLHPKGEAPPRVSFKTDVMVCPDRLAASSPTRFLGGGCTPGDIRCTDTCRPNVSLQPSTLAGDLDAICKEAGVLCVGAGRALENLADLPKKLQDDVTIVRVILTKGEWKGPLELAGLTRAITLEGVANDEADGTRLLLDEQADAPEDYAALRIESSADITLKRLRVRGGGVGILIRSAKIVTLEDLVLTGNVLSGLKVESAEEVRMTRCDVSRNGLPQKPDSTKEAIKRLRYGVFLAKVKMTSILECEIAYNGAGGLARAWEAKAVGITNDHRVVGYEKYGVGITNDHKVAMTASLVHHNGPIAADARTSTDNCSSSCADGAFCEAGICRPPLVVDAQEPAKGREILGVGVHLAGVGSVEISGCAFYANDVSGLVAHSASTVSLLFNAFEYNGVRDANLPADLANRFAYPAVHIWHVQRNFTATANVLSRNYDDGLRLGHARVEGQTIGALKAEITSNSFWDQGLRRAPSEFPRGTGLRLAHDTAAVSGNIAVQGNFFFHNGAAGLGITGTGDFVVERNLFRGERLRAIAMHDVETSNTRISQNTIENGVGFGIQLFDITGIFNLSGNWIEGVASLSSDNSEGDGLNVTNLKSGSVLLESSIFRRNGRAGIFLDAARMELVNNEFAPETSLILQNDARFTGDVPNTQTVRSPLTNRKIAFP